MKSYIGFYLFFTYLCFMTGKESAAFDTILQRARGMWWKWK